MMTKECAAKLSASIARWYWPIMPAHCLKEPAGAKEALRERAVLVEGRVHQSTMDAHGSVIYPHDSARIVGPETLPRPHAIIATLQTRTSLKELRATRRQHRPGQEQ
jgi:hypothetical protein